MKDTIKIGYIGLGRRGKGMLKACFSQMKDVMIKTLCDLVPERVTLGQEIVQEKGGYTPCGTTDYHDILNDPEIDAVIIMTGWSGRPALAMESMRAGKYTAIEVGCADTLEECFDLVRTYEETGIPVMMLENCCYGRREMMLYNMAWQGLFGEIVHCTGGYMHYLNELELFKDIGDHYRLPHYIARNRENYPTHELGPISKLLHINRGNRLLRLSSFASKSCGLRQYAADTLGEDHELAKTDFKQGDIVTTVLTCANGETVVLTLDTTVPRAYYSRNIGIRGTKGMSYEDTRVVFLEGMEEKVRDNEAEFFERYDHPLHREYEAMGTRGGHGGMDWLVCRAFVESVKNGTEPPIDVYDTATWLAIGPLSERSIEQGGAPMEIPDFTNGLWQTDRPTVRGKYCLDEVCEDPNVSIF